MQAILDLHSVLAKSTCTKEFICMLNTDAILFS